MILHVDPGVGEGHADPVPDLVLEPQGPLVVSPAGLPNSRSVLLSVVAPTFNEAKNLAQLVEQLTVALKAGYGGAFELIVVDDDSPDRTWELGRTLARQNPHLRVMRRTRERGLSSAVIRGWQVARGELLAVIDADLQHPPEVLVSLLQEMQRGADLAVASRHVEGGGVSDWSAVRRVISRTAQVIGLVILPGVVGRISDPMSGYFVVRRTAIEDVELHPLGYKILIEVLGRGRCRWISEVPYVFRERVAGASKVSLRVYVHYVRHLLRLRLATLPLTRFVRFAVVGLSGVVVDMGLLFLLSDPSMLGLGLTRSKLVAAQAAIINNFIWNDLWTFGDVSARQHGVGSRWRRFLKFEMVCLAGLVINTVILNLEFNYLGMNRYLANAIAIAVVTGWNFWLNLKLSWRST